MTDAADLAALLGRPDHNATAKVAYNNKMAYPPGQPAWVQLVARFYPLGESPTEGYDAVSMEIRDVPEAEWHDACALAAREKFGHVLQEDWAEFVRIWGLSTPREALPPVDTASLTAGLFSRRSS